MAVRQCSHCDELMQKGFSVESDEGYYLYCSDECMFNEFDSEDEYKLDIEAHDWQDSEMDDEDFTILANVLLSDPSYGQIADVFDILNREKKEFYGENGVLDLFITFLNEMEERGDVYSIF